MAIGNRIKSALRRPRSTADPLVSDLQAAVGADRVHNDGAQRTLLARDASVFSGGVAGPVCYPKAPKKYPPS